MVSSIYIHIPFCSNICSYCAFTKQFYNEKLVESYLKSLKKEIDENYKNELIKTLYIGGGTPSSLKINELKELFNILKIIKLAKEYEFTFEVNPENIDKEKLILLKENGVNRISMGVESTNLKLLNYLGRKHDFNLVKDKIKLIKELGFNNINVDLIYAIPNETIDDLKKALDNIISLNVNHISTYSLMIEPHTILYINKEKNIDEELDFEMYNLICNTLKENGFNHYEISNFSKIGYESHHNLVYWNNQEYYGFGLGASGYLYNIRYTNTNILDEYINNFKREEEILSLKDKISYELILGFRKINGINKNDFYDKYKIDIHEVYNIKELLEKEYLEENNTNIYVKYDKIYIENSILINFIGE